MRKRSCTALVVVAEKQVEHVLHGGDVFGFDLDQATRFWVHGGEPHHVGVVLTKTF